MRTTAYFAALLLAIAVGACTPDTGDNPDRASGNTPYQIVTTVGMVGDIAEHVAGDKAEVSVIIGPGVDPHLYTATRDDVVEMRDADIIFYNGLLLEGRMTDTLIAVARSKPVYAVTELLDDDYLIEAQGHHDPHVWMDVSAWSRAVEVVARSLAQFDPGNAGYYERNAERYQKQLAALHEYGLQRIATIPGSGGDDEPLLITSHDAFNYFGKAYGLDVQGVQGLSTESEAGLKRINDLIDLIVETGTAAVFVETTVSRQNIEALIEGAHARGHEVEIGGELFSDAMGPEGSYEGTYIGMLDHNLTTVARALGGDAPARGMRGKLNTHE
ncbi:MAG: metal ABC transporter solute-binding protein, Zn/Mn family [Gammaproteobacteria bacterium]